MLPEKFMLPEDRIPDCRDQGKNKICIAFAITAVLQVVYYIKTGEWRQFSPSWGAAVWRSDMDAQKDMKGLTLQSAIPKSVEIGAVLTDDFPDLCQNPEAYEYVQAHPELWDKCIKLIDGFEEIKGSKATKIEAIKETLIKYQIPIVAAVKDKPDDHCVPVIGWDNGKGVIKVMNSFGNRGGAMGHDSYKYEDIRKAYILRPIEEEDNMSCKTYSLKKDGEKQLSKNFKVKEFSCKDGSDKILIDTELVALLQNIRDFFGKPVTITSAYRHAAYNEMIGGAAKSQHINGTAADIVVNGVDPLMVARYVEMVMPDSGGIGYYYADSNFTHVDVRTSKARWKNGAGGKDVSVKNHGMIYAADIINELYARGIITDKELWQKKLNKDKNAYWLARKAAAFTVNRGRNTTYGDVCDVDDIVKALNQRGIITDTELWKRELPEDINLYWLARKICNMTK